MKFASYELSGRPTWGAVIGDGLLDLGPKYGATLSIAHGDRGGALAGIAQRARRARKPSRAMSDGRVPADDPRRRQDHLHRPQLQGARRGRRRQAARVSERVRALRRVAGRARAAASACRSLSTDYDYEGELALVIGTGGRHIARERAL